jgi:Domain of unknown function (DUF4386)
MTDSFSHRDRLQPQAGFASIQTYARIAGALFLLSLLAGGLGEFYIPTKFIVSGDAAATARNITASPALFRIGFATYLVEAVCDTTLTLVLYVLLRPAERTLALLAAFFRIISTAVFAGTELFYFAPLFILRGDNYLKTFSPAQIDTLSFLSLKLYGYGGDIFMVFYGIGCILSGYLIFGSTYLPKLLGVLLAFGGLGFVARNLAVVLTPAYASPYLALPMMIGVVALTLWLLFRGVDSQRWQEKALVSEATAVP